MALTKEKKQKIVEELSQNIDNQKIIIFTSFKGVKNKDLSVLRKELKPFLSNLTVAKKTLMKLSFEKKGLNVDYDALKDEAAVIFGFKDEIAPAKTVFEFSKKNPEIRIIGGVLGGSFRSAEDIIELAKIPSREELLTRLVGTIQSPISGFANALQGNIKGLINVLSKVKI